jgi:hypothetical protein
MLLSHPRDLALDLQVVFRFFFVLVFEGRREIAFSMLAAVDKGDNVINVP